MVYILTISVLYCQIWNIFLSYFFVKWFNLVNVNSNVVFDLDLAGSKSLICYQCNSSSKEEISLCQIGYFKLNKPWQKWHFSFQCPPHIADYCFVIEEKLSGEKRTARGCYSNKDKTDRDIKTGCLVENNKTMCFCKQSFCNSSQVLSSFKSVMIILWYCLKYTF